MDAKPKTIVVVLNSSTSEKELLLTQLEAIVNPGDRVEFLIKYRQEVVPWFFAHVALMQTGSETAIACEERRTRTSWEVQERRMERDIVEPARRKFSRIGVDVNLHAYSGSLRSVLDDYVERRETTVFVGITRWSGGSKIVPMSLRDWFVSRRRHQLPIVSVHPSDQFLGR